MKIVNIKTDKIYKFNFLERNLFLCKSLDTIYEIQSIHESLFSSKSSNTKYTINYSDTDFKIDRTNRKLIAVPSYIEFYKDIHGGNKTILKELVSLVLDFNFFSNEDFVLAKNYIDSLNFSNLKPLVYLNEIIKKAIGYSVEFSLQDNILDYLSSNLTLNILNDEEIIISETLNQMELKKIYLSILSIIVKQQEKESFFLFINPFIGLNSFEVSEIIEQIKELKSYSIISNSFYSLDMESLISLKIELKHFLDIANIFDNLEEYQIYWSSDSKSELQEFTVSLLNKFLNLNLLCNENENLQYLSKNELSFLEIIKNKQVF